MSTGRTSFRIVCETDFRSESNCSNIDCSLTVLCPFSGVAEPNKSFKFTCSPILLAFFVWTTGMLAEKYILCVGAKVEVTLLNVYITPSSQSYKLIFPETVHTKKAQLLVLFRKLITVANFHPFDGVSGVWQ